MWLFTTSQEQQEMTRWTENKYFTEPPNYTYVQQNKQMLMLLQRLFWPKPDTNAQMYRPTDWHLEKRMDTK